MFQSLLFLSAMFLASTTLAHVTLETPTAAHGSYYKAILRVPHGCDGSTTTGIKVFIPEGFNSIKPMPKPGWTISTDKDAKGNLTAVSFSGGKLPDGFYDEFVVRGKIEAAADSTLYVKVSQTCEKGKTDWFEIPGKGQDDHSVKAPAVALKITAAQ